MINKYTKNNYWQFQRIWILVTALKTSMCQILSAFNIFQINQKAFNVVLVKLDLTDHLCVDILLFWSNQIKN